MTVLTAAFATCAFQTSLGGQEVEIEDRRFILIPVSGCDGDVVKGQNVILNQLTVGDFGEGDGWPDGTVTIIGALEIGESVCTNDGIAQEQIVVRII